MEGNKGIGRHFLSKEVVIFIRASIPGADCVYGKLIDYDDNFVFIRVEHNENKVCAINIRNIETVSEFDEGLLDGDTEEELDLGPLAPSNCGTLKN